MHILTHNPVEDPPENDRIVSRHPHLLQEPIARFLAQGAGALVVSLGMSGAKPRWCLLVLDTDSWLKVRWFI